MTDQDTIIYIRYPCNASTHDLYISPFIDYWVALHRMKSYISVYCLFYFATQDLRD